MRKRIERPDQHSHWKQLIHVARHRQRDESERVLQTVSALAEIGQFIDKIEEGEQAEKCGEYKQRGAVDLPRHVGAQGIHFSALRAANPREAACKKAARGRQAFPRAPPTTRY